MAPAAEPAGPAGEPRPTLRPRQVAAARWLALGHGVCDVARELGVNRRTVTRWNTQPAFAAEVRRLQQKLEAAMTAQVRSVRT